MDCRSEGQLVDLRPRDPRAQAAITDDGRHWMVDGKADDRANDPEVNAKKDAGFAGARFANDSGGAPETWHYPVATETAIRQAGGTWNVLKSFFVNSRQLGAVVCRTVMQPPLGQARDVDRIVGLAHPVAPEAKDVIDTTPQAPRPMARRQE